MILSPHNLGSGTFNRHLIARAHKKKARKRMLLVGLTLTSMVDMFSLLVIFLLQTFSASPMLMVVQQGVTLPVAMTAAEIKDAPVLSLSDAGVYLDQKFIGLTDDLLDNPDPLMNRLEQLRRIWQKNHPNDAFRGEIVLQADKSLSSALVSQFMGMLPSQNYRSIQLAVVSGGS